VECLLCLKNILERKPEYWSEFIEPYLREMEEQRKDGRKDGDDEVFRDVQEELIAWNVMTSSSDNVSRSHDILLNRIMQYTVDVD